MSSGVTTLRSDLPIFPYSWRTGSPFHVNPVGASADSTTSSAGTYTPRASVYAQAWT
jgi:hypothetical protein